MLVVVAGGLRAQRVLNLDSCRSLSIANNKNLLMAKEKMEKARYDRKAAFTNFLPDFSATGGYMFFSEEISLLDDGQKARLSGVGTRFQQGFVQAATPLIQQIAQASPQLAASMQQAMQGGALSGIWTNCLPPPRTAMCWRWRRRCITILFPRP